MSPEQRTIRGKLAAHDRWGRTGPEGRAKQSQAMRAGKLRKWLAEVDAENPGLTDAERYKLAAGKEQAHMLRLSLASSRARKSVAK